MNDSASSQNQAHIQAIDALRGIAILSVLIYHWITQPFSSMLAELRIYNMATLGAYGVDLFFVISGFLIGRILLKLEKGLSLISFYLKRIFRIWPLYYLLLGTVYVVGGGLKVFGEIPYWSYFLFIFNFWESFVGLKFSPAFLTLWSLALEEQFYLAGPLIFFFLDKGKLKYLVLTGIMILPVARWILINNTKLDVWRFTPLRVDGILAGIFISIILASQDIASTLISKAKLLKILTSTLFLLSLLCRAILSYALWVSFGNTLMVLSFGFLLTTILVQHSLSQNGLFLNSKVLRYLGIRCYSIYLFHLFFAILAGNLTNFFFAKLVIQATLTLGFAHISWKYFEYPLIVFARRFQY